VVVEIFLPSGGVKKKYGGWLRNYQIGIQVAFGSFE
jgi:hypothetical protein